MDCQFAIKMRDGRIAELEAQAAEAAKTTEAVDALRGDVAALKRQSVSNVELQIPDARLRPFRAH